MLFQPEQLLDAKQKHTLKINITKYLEATTGGVLLKNIFLKISQNSHENTCAEVSFFKRTLY